MLLHVLYQLPRVTPAIQQCQRRRKNVVTNAAVPELGRT